MKHYLSKVKLILPTFFTIAFLNVTILLLARWLLSIHTSILDIKEDYWEYWIPITTAGVSVFIYLRRKAKCIRYSEDRHQIILVIAWISITASSCIAQHYLKTNTGKLQHLNTISQIDNYKPTAYYKIDSFNLLNDYYAEYIYIHTTGKHGKKLTADIFFAVPIVDKTNTPLHTLPKYWYGIKSSKSVHNTKDKREERINELQEFYVECVSRLESYNYYDLEYFEKLNNSDLRENYLQAIYSSYNEEKQEYTILVPVNEPFAVRNGNKLLWIFLVFFIGTALILITIIFGKLDKRAIVKLRKKKSFTREIKTTLITLLPQKDYLGMYILISINILIFLLMLLAGISILEPKGSELYAWGALSRDSFLNGEWWRLVTYMFLHAGAQHLIVNIAGLFLGTIFLEPKFGKWKLLLIYLACGVVAGVVSIWWHSDSISVGASGAIMGLFGIILGLVIFTKGTFGEKKGMLMLFGSYVLLTLFFGLFGNADNAAHVGGFLFGLVVGIFLKIFEKPVSICQN